MYRAIDLSVYIVSKCIAEHHPIGNLHLQRILFSIQKCFVQQRGEPAFYDEIEAWPIGPVVPEVYNHYFPRYGAMPITHIGESYLLCPEDVGCINSIIEHIREKALWDLFRELHGSKGAWAHVYNYGLGNHNAISIDLIKIYG